MNEPKVLAVDDEPGILRMLGLMLGTLGCQVLTADDAEQALAIIEEEKPQVIVVDVRLPGMSGAELASLVKSSGDLCETKVILISAYNEPFGHPADHFLAKPFDPDQLLRLVKRYFPDLSAR